MSQIDYVKLAKSNQIFFHWKNQLHEMMIGPAMRDIRIKYKLGYNRNFYHYVKFFKNDTKIACEYLGIELLNDLPKMFFAETVENDLIVQYLPAIYSEMGKHIIPPKVWDDLYDCLLLGLRDSVWRYSREDIKFSTYAINGLRNNIKFFMCDSSRLKRMKDSCGIPFSDLGVHINDRNMSEYEQDIIDSKETVDRLELADLVRDIAQKANATEGQMQSLEFYMAHGYAESDKCSDARRKLKRFVAKNTDQFQDVLN